MSINVQKHNNKIFEHKFYNKAFKYKNKFEYEMNIH